MLLVGAIVGVAISASSGGDAGVTAVTFIALFMAALFVLLPWDAIRLKPLHATAGPVSYAKALGLPASPPTTSDTPMAETSEPYPAANVHP